MDIASSSFAPGVAQQYYGGSVTGWTRASPVQVVPSQVSSSLNVTPRCTRNPGIVDVLSSIFDEMEYTSADPQKPLPAPPLKPKPQSLFDAMVNFHVDHIKL
ncbi:hypothetical protein GN958_ATG22789 [Phytophthora infestans]|nr:hypothetical protein GN958_ATG22789 [Phytophthora infestans]